MAIDRQGSTYPTYAGGRAPFRITGKRGTDSKALTSSLGDQYSSSIGMGDNIDKLLGSYFDDPSGGAGMYQDIYAKAANAAAAPAQRDFGNSIQTAAASIGRRWGGNASSEESRVVGNASDMFSRNLTDALARVGPQAVQAGQARGSQLMSASNSYATRGLDIAQLIQSALQKQSKNPWAKLLGTAAGGVGGFLLDGPKGAMTGAQLGNDVGGAF